MKRTNRLLLLICGTAMPLFTGCGGCGAPSVSHMQATRGDWGVEEDPEPYVPPKPAAPVVVQSPTPPSEASAPPPPAAAPPTANPPAATLAPATTTVPPAVAEESPAAAVAPEPVASVPPQPNPTSPPLAAPVANAVPVPSEEAVLSAPANPTVVARPPRVTEDPVPSGEPAEPVGPAFEVASAAAQALPERLPTIDQPTITLLPQAKEFAPAGKELDVDRMLLGEAMLRDRLEEWPFEMRWSPALKRPTPWIRAGVAFYVNATDVRSDMAPIPAKDRALEREFGPMGRDVLDLGGELAEKSLAAHLTLLRAGKLGPTLAPHATGPIDTGRPLPARLCGGLVLLGPGEPRILKAHAERLGLDLLIVYDVRAKRNVDDPAQPINDTSVKIIDVVGDREIFATKLLRNLEVQATRKNPVAPDPVDPVAAEIQKFLDTQLPLTDFPAEVRPDNVRGRLPKLVDQALASKNALPYLVEIKALYLHGYLAGLEAQDAYIAILGDSEGRALYAGTPEERLLALERLLPRRQEGAKTVDTASVSD